MNKSKLKFGTSTEPAPNLLSQLLGKLDSLDLEGSEFPLSLSVATPSVNVWEWLAANEGLPRVVWGDRDSARTMGGVGVADDISVEGKDSYSSAVELCRKTLNGDRRLRYFGGLAFDASAEWPVFGAGRFIIPRITLADGVMTLAVMDPADIHQAKQDLQRIRFEFGDFPNSLPRLISKNYLPNRDGWDARVREALSLIQNEALEKIVLSRQTNLQFESRLNPISLAHELSRTTHDCFVFCFNFGPESSFLGATPERLFYRHGQVLQSEVVAGTRMRGSNVEEDQNLEQDLLDSDKDQREHDIVRKSIRQKLHKFVEQLEVDSQASILKLARKQHLRSNVLGMLKPDVDDGMLLSRLHPTPAVGGYPTDNALPEIARIEPFNRGWYAAPVGWIGSDSAHFAVAIRSGWAVADRLSLFSGAGIVRGSRPEAEWEEVENKIQDFLSIFRD